MRFTAIETSKINLVYSVLYRNNGDRTFTAVTRAAGVANGNRVGAGTCFLDVEGDGDLDLYVANYIDCTMDDVLAAQRTNVWRKTAQTMTGPFGLRGGKARVPTLELLTRLCVEELLDPTLFDAAFELKLPADVRKLY